MSSAADQNDRANNNWSVDRTLRATVLVLLLVGLLLVLKPFLSAILWAVVLCFTTWPVYVHLLRIMRGRRTWAALVMTIVIALALLAPFALIGVSLGDEVQRAAERFRGALESGPPPPPKWFAKVPVVGNYATSFWNDMIGGSAARIARLRTVIEPMKETLLRISVVIGNGLLDLVLSFLLAYFIFRDGEAAAIRLARGIERIGGTRGRELLDIAGATVRGVVYGILGTAIAQSLLAGFGLWLAGVPQPGLLMVLVFFLSIIPVGPPLVWLPAAIWLFYKGSIGWGIFMTIWGAVVISGVDNIIKPLIISRGSQLPFILILMGVIGGAAAFGLIGVFLGPTLVAVAYRLIIAWTEMPEPLTPPPTAPPPPPPPAPVAVTS